MIAAFQCPPWVNKLYHIASGKAFLLSLQLGWGSVTLLFLGEEQSLLTLQLSPAASACTLGVSPHSTAQRALLCVPSALGFAQLLSHTAAQGRGTQQMYLRHLPTYISNQTTFPSMILSCFSTAFLT